MFTSQNKTFVILTFISPPPFPTRNHPNTHPVVIPDRKPYCRKSFMVPLREADTAAEETHSNRETNTITETAKTRGFHTQRAEGPETP